MTGPLDEAVQTAKQRLRIWDGYGGDDTPESVIDQANGVADSLRTLLSALRSRPTVEEVARVIGWHFARLVSRNPQPSMSGDPRDHIQPWERQRFSRAEVDAAQAVLSLFGEEGK